MIIHFWKVKSFFLYCFFPECIYVWCSFISKYIHKATHFFSFLFREEREQLHPISKYNKPRFLFLVFVGCIYNSVKKQPLHVFFVQRIPTELD